MKGSRIGLLLRVVQVALCTQVPSSRVSEGHKASLCLTAAAMPTFRKGCLYVI